MVLIALSSDTLWLPYPCRHRRAALMAFTLAMVRRQSVSCEGFLHGTNDFG
jgi:hypothetical protein